MNLKWISTERKKSIRRIFPEWWPKRQEIIECEINYSQVIRFLKTGKLQFNFLEKVSARENERKEGRKGNLIRMYTCWINLKATASMWRGNLIWKKKLTTPKWNWVSDSWPRKWERTQLWIILVNHS